LAHYRGKPVVVNFFASWCTECQAELPGFRQEAIALKGKVTFIGVDSLETGDKNFLPSLFHLARAFAALARDVGPNGNGLHAALGGGNTMPMTAFYSANGRLLDVERGALVPAGTLQAKIAQLYGIT
jgi:thiol-disulfide isomerase/thioredoxin